MRFRPLLALAAALLLIRPATQAATLIFDFDGSTANGITDGSGGTWDTTSTNKVWFDGANDVAWTNSTTNTAQFGGGSSGTAGTVAVGAVTTNGISFEAPFAGSYSLTGGTITLGGTTPTITTDVDAAISSVIAGSGVSLTKAGAGMLTLSGASTYSGGTILNAGTLQVTDSTVYSAASSTITIKGFGSGALTLNGGTLQLRANGTDTNTAQTLTYGNNTTIAGDVTIDVNRQGGSGTVKTLALGNLSIGANALTVTGGNSYVLRFNTVTLTGDATFNVVSTAANLFFNNAVAGGTNAITKSGAGTLSLNGGGTFGDLNITGGNVDFNVTSTVGNVTTSGTGNFSSHSGDNVTMASLAYNSTGTSIFNALSASSTYTINGAFSMSAGKINFTAGTTGNPATSGVITKLILKGDVSITGTSSFGANTAPGTALVDLNGANRIFTVGTGATFTNPIITQNGGVDKEGAGILIMSGANTYAGGTTINGGTLRTSGTGTLGDTTANLAVNSGGTLDLFGTSQTVNSFNGTGSGVVTNGSATAATLNVGSEDGSAVYQGAINNGMGTVALVKNGAGTLELDGNSTYSGGTTLNGGKLIAVDSSTFSGSAVAKAFGTGALLANNGTTVQLRANGDGTTTAQTLTYNNNTTVAGNVTFDIDRVSGSGTTKTLAFGNLSMGAGILTVTGTSKYILRFNSTTLTGDATFNLVEASTGLTLNAAITGNGHSVTLTGAGLLTMQGGTFGDFNINSGHADVFVTMNTQNVTVGSNGFFSTHSGDHWTMNSLAYNSTATSEFTALSTDSTYTIGAGGLTMSKGILNVRADAATTSTLTLQGNVTITGTSKLGDSGTTGTRLVDLGGGVRTFDVSGGATFTEGVVMQNGGILKSNAGTMIVTNANTYAGGTTISGGTFQAGNSTGSATGTGQVTVSGGTLAGAGILGPTGVNNVLVNGTGSINPGDAAGDRTATLTINSDLIMDAASGGRPAINLEIEGKTAGLFDRIAGINTFTLDGTINVAFINGFTGSTLVAGDSFDLIDAVAMNAASFDVNSDLHLPDISGFGLAWDSSHFLDAGPSGGVVSVITSVPEPSRLLLCLSTFGLLLLRRRRI